VNDIPKSIKDRYAALFRLAPRDQKIYLVGGVVRDWVLEKENKDIDVLCEHDSFGIARQWAELNRGAFYVLDEGRGTSRVILDNHGEKSVFDFARQQGNTLEEDLSARDFTINAMAIDFTSLDTVIDPMHGIDDLRQGKLRACSSASFKLDPVRVIRAFRYAAAYKLSIDPNTKSILTLSVPALRMISEERKRDEFFKILDLDDPIEALKQLQETEIISQIGLPLQSDEGFTFIASLVNWLTLVRKETSDTNANKYMIEESLIRYRKQYAAFLNQRNTSDRNLRQLLLLFSLIRGLGEEKIVSIAQQLLLANEEIQRLTCLMKFQQDINKLMIKEEPITDRELYTFFNHVGVVGLDLCWLMLAGQSDSQRQKAYLHRAGRIFECWFEHPQVANPVPFLNGNDLMIQFDLTPGPTIGKLLNQMKEEQAAGIITNRQQALEWIEAQVSSLKNRQYWENQE
jgi:tRNA nucleotidyltransferase/poly(A) polymerase